MIYISIDDDFDLDRIAASGQCFRWEKLGDGHYRIPYREMLLEIEDVGDGEFAMSCTEDEFYDVWGGYFDLETDYRWIRKRIDWRKDQFLAVACDDQKGIRILRQDLWEMTVTSIITQNRNIPAITRSVEELSKRAGEKKEAPDGTVYYTFPGPEAILAMSGEDLDACRLGYRARYVCCAAEAAVKGELDPQRLLQMKRSERMAVLTSVCGIGEKVASCILLFGLHDLDAFPKDVWINRVLEEQYRDGYPFEEYSPYNGVYQQYMFAYYGKLMGKTDAAPGPEGEDR